jgi:DNA-binding YbaB/EbfC family protein
MAKRKRKGKGFKLGGGGGGLSVPGGAKGGLAGQMQAMQQQMLEAQEALGDKTVEISSGGGAVTVVMSGHQKLESIIIDPEVIDPEDAEMLQDLIMAAVNEAVESSQNLAADEMGAITGGLNIPGLI